MRLQLRDEKVALKARARSNIVDARILAVGGRASFSAQHSGGIGHERVVKAPDQPVGVQQRGDRPGGVGARLNPKQERRSPSRTCSLMNT